MDFLLKEISLCPNYLNQLRFKATNQLDKRFKKIKWDPLKVLKTILDLHLLVHNFSAKKYQIKV